MEKSGLLIGSGLWACAIAIAVGALLNSGDRTIFLATSPKKELNITTDINGGLTVNSDVGGFELTSSNFTTDVDVNGNLTVNSGTGGFTLTADNFTVDTGLTSLDVNLDTPTGGLDVNVK